MVLKGQACCLGTIEGECDLVGELGAELPRGELRPEGGNAYQQGPNRKEVWSSMEQEGTACGKPCDKKEREKTRAAGAGECGKHGLAPILQRCYNGMQQKVTQGTQDCFVQVFIHPEEMRHQRNRTANFALGSFSLFLQGETSRAGKSYGECNVTTCLMGMKTFALKLK